MFDAIDSAEDYCNVLQYVVAECPSNVRNLGKLCEAAGILSDNAVQISMFAIKVGEYT